MALRRRQALRRALPVGPERPDVQHQGLQEAADFWSVVFERAEAAGRQAQQGPRAGVRRPDLHCRRRAVPDEKKPELGIKDPYELNETQYAPRSTLLRTQHPLVQRYWHDANVQVQDFTNEGIVASSSWPFQVNTLQANKQPIATTVPAEGATGWADTTMLHAQAQASELRLQVAGVVAHAEGAGRRRRVVRLVRRCPRPARATRCSAPKAARPTASRTSTRSFLAHAGSGKCAIQGTCVPYSRWATDYVADHGRRGLSVSR